MKNNDKADALEKAILDVTADHAILDLLVAERKKVMTQVSMADAMGVSVSSVASFEAEASNPWLSMIRHYARVLGLTVGVVLED